MRGDQETKKIAKNSECKNNDSKHSVEEQAHGSCVPVQTCKPIRTSPNTVSSLMIESTVEEDTLVELGRDSQEELQFRLSL